MVILLYGLVADHLEMIKSTKKYITEWKICKGSVEPYVSPAIAVVRVNI